MFPVQLSQRTTTLALLVLAAAFVYQTFSLARLSIVLASADLNLGGGSSAVNFASDGTAPSMVGGC